MLLFWKNIGEKILVSALQRDQVSISFTPFLFILPDFLILTKLTFSFTSEPLWAYGEIHKGILKVSATFAWFPTSNDSLQLQLQIFYALLISFHVSHKIN
jgi:hypothetical protein